MRAVVILAIGVVTVGCARAGVTATGSSSPQAATSTAVDRSAQIENWRHDNRSAFSVLGEAMSDLGDAMVAETPDWNAIHADCTKLTGAAHTMSKALPSPDDRLNAALGGALDNITAAMNECPSLSASSDRIDANAFVTNLQQEFDHLNVVKEIMG